MYKTRITELLGIKYPIIQGAMLWLSKAELVSAVSNAGGLGIISGLSFTTSDELRQEIRKTKTMTDKPFAVNITLLPTRRPINYEEYVKAIIDEGVGIIETAGRSPEAYVPMLKEAKVKIMHKVARARDARSVERLGVDAVSIVGFEAGGHPGMEDVPSFVRIPTCVDSVKIPVIAGGGIADGRGLAAALALGAEGVLMGTRFMASEECPLHQNIKGLLLQLDETGTMMIERSIKMAARVIRTDYSQKVLEMEEKGATLEELLPMLEGARGKACYASGDTSGSVLYCGEAVGLVHDIPTVKEIIERTIAEAQAVMQCLTKMGLAG